MKDIKKIIKDLYTINQAFKVIAPVYSIDIAGVSCLGSSTDITAQNAYPTYINISAFEGTEYSSLRDLILSSRCRGLCIPSLELFKLLKVTAVKNSIVDIHIMPSDINNVSYLRLVSVTGEIYDLLPLKTTIGNAISMYYNASEMYNKFIFNGIKVPLISMNEDQILSMITMKSQITLDIPYNNLGLKTFISKATISGPFAKKALLLDVTYIMHNDITRQGYMVKYSAGGLTHHMYFRSVAFN